MRLAWRRWLDSACVVLASVILCLVFLRHHAADSPSAAADMAFLRDPHAEPSAAMGWWAWWDQGFYHRAAVAWANGVTDPVFHWYLPGYPLLGAAFVRVFPNDPFLVPDLACYLGSLWLFCRVAVRLLDDVPWPVPVACAVFLASSVLPERALWSWVVPWTSTPEALLIFAALLGAIRLAEAGRCRDAFLTGLATVAIAGFRPADAAMVGLAIGVVTGPTLISRHRLLAGNIAAAMAGASIPLLIFGGAYLATWGTRASTYLVLSSAIGFEPRLLPLRWVTLMIDPRPLYPEGRGLAGVFFWIAPGIAGMAASLVSVRRATSHAHRLVIFLLVGDLVLLLTYRDLHPTGLWNFGNFHYFKWMLPVFALYACRLIPTAMIRDRRRALALGAACLTVPALFCWRAAILPIELLRYGDGGTAITLGTGLRPIDAMVVVPGHGPEAQPTVQASAVTSSGSILRYGVDFVAYAGKQALRIIPLRPLPSERTTIRFAPGTTIDSGSAPLLARQAISWGPPFWLAQDKRVLETASFR